MMSRRPGNKAGFTIIEVVLVLAIAALIFLVVLLALPTLQRSQRDTQRKQNLTQVLSSIQTWISNHQGNSLDTQPEIDNLESTFLSNLFDPSTATPYTIDLRPTLSAHVTAEPPPGTIVYQVGHICGSDTGSTTYTTESAFYSHSAKQLAVLLTLESGGVFCLDVE